MSVATGVSADGNVVIGYVNQGGTVRAFYWTESTGAQMMMGFGGANIAANDISPDGRVVVGYADYPDYRRHACRWLDPNQPPQDIHTMSNSTLSIAWDVSASGDIVVGQYHPTGGTVSLAFRWTPQRGMEDLNTVYADLLPIGSVLFHALAMSPDGRFIVGSGINGLTGRREVFLLDSGFPAARTAAMSTKTAVWTTPTCWRCCSRLGRRGRTWGASMSTATRPSMTPTC